jgi:hypothetical protein
LWSDVGRRLHLTGEFVVADHPKYEQMTRAQRKAYEESASDLDFLDRGWIRRIRAKEGTPPKRKKLAKMVTR